MKKDNRGISELVSYVLLISLAVVMAGTVFAYLKFYAEKPLAEKSCPEVSLIIQDYSCLNKTLSLSVRNQGRFDVEGYIIKINDGKASQSLDYKGSNYIIASISPGMDLKKEFDYSEYGSIKSVEIEPFRGKDKYGNPMLCEKSIIRQEVENC
jgi:hypothetical protein